MQTAGGALSYLGLMRARGADAVAFLQGQLSNDVRTLGRSHVLPAAFANLQGRVVALMTLLPHSSGVLAVMPRELVAGTIDRLRRYVLRSKVTVEDVSGEFTVLGMRDPQAQSFGLVQWPEGDAQLHESDGIACARIPGDSQRGFCIGTQADLSSAGLDALLAQDASHTWRADDVRAGMAQVYSATSEQFVAQMLNLDALGALSFTKGCYTGQEIIARTQHLGRIKRRMFHVDLPAGDWPPGTALRLPGRAGRIVDSFAHASGVSALAVLPIDADAGPVEADAQTPALIEARVRPPSYLADLLGPHVREQEHVADRG